MPYCPYGNNTFQKGPSLRQKDKKTERQTDKNTDNEQDSEEI